MSENDNPRPALDKLKDDLRQLRDEIQLKAHLGGMEVREQWEILKPKLEKIEVQVSNGLIEAESDVLTAAEALRDDLRKLWAKTRE